MIITIDGPAGSGKSSVAKELAERLNIYYLNTGLLYRAVGFVWLKSDPELKNINLINKNNLNFIKNIEYKYVDKNPQVFYENKNITGELLNNSLSQAASLLSALPEIRQALLDLQRNVAKKYDIVCEGRDCGSVIFPNADYKFYLTATLYVRAKRIFQDKNRKDNKLTLEKVKEELEVRDLRDQTRKVAPLIIPEQAIVVDNSSLNQEETLKLLLSLIKFN
ncbi:MAG: Cytidylate kinase [candidate division TM6 bacterium GW2011_GWF2_28_16]|nr:MAG: Cytidylate kinase [candidate division TM6 bacterium GW2011_GWF2_28_16]